MPRAGLTAAAALLLLAAPLAAAMAAGDAGAASAHVELQRQDARLHRIAWRLAEANAGLCGRVAPSAGIALHHVDQYRDREGARAAFGFAAPLAVLAVAPGSPADGEIAPGAILLEIGDQPVPAETGETGQDGKDRADALLEQASAGGAVTLRLGAENAVQRLVRLPAVPVCDARFQLQPGAGMKAEADGRLVTLGSGLLDAVPDDQMLAAVIAHELAHTALGHAGWLDRNGRQGRHVRATETAADRLSVWLMANAGYDPAAAIAFWEGPGRKVDLGILRARSHPARPVRIATIRAEIARLGGAARDPDGKVAPDDPVLRPLYWSAGGA